MYKCLFNDDHPGLLVSVRNADESRMALAGGADVIDVKEPSRGSLGAANADVVAGVVAEVARRAPVSMAAGELLEFAAEESFVGEGVAFVKFGLASCHAIGDWQARWRAALAAFPDFMQAVAVAYADWQRAAAPPPEDVLAAAIAVGVPVLLVDTWDKSAGTLFDHWSPAETVSYCQRARDAGIAVVLAGSLQGKCLHAAVRCRPHLVGVRGAVCEGDRSGPISLARVAAVRAAIDGLRKSDNPSRCHTSVTASSASGAP